MHSSIQDLYESPIKLQQFINAIPLAVLVMDGAGKVLIANRAFEALTGFTQKEILGLPCRYIVRSSICVSSCLQARLKADSEPVSAEADILTGDRKKISVFISAAGIVNGTDRLVGFIATYRKLEKRKEPEFEFGRALLSGRVVGVSQDLKRVYQRIPAVAQTDSSVLIQSDPGMGKDYIAEAVHQLSARNHGPFVMLECCDTSEPVLETELFGDSGGKASSGGLEKTGKLRLAHNGSLYLSDVADLPIGIQSKLLTFLDESIIYPVGSAKGVHVDVRLIAGTRSDLKVLVKEGRFREDLYYRLSAMPLKLKPLVDKRDDINVLLDYCLRTMAVKFNKKIKQFGPRAHRALLSYDYPENLKELRSIMEFAVDVCDCDHIRLVHLPGHVAKFDSNYPIAATHAAHSPEDKVGADTLNWEHTERRMIEAALKKAGGRKTKAATLLGWARSTLWRKLKQYNIEC